MFMGKRKSSATIIGGADGPTSIFIGENNSPAYIPDGMEIGTINAVNINDVASVEIQRDGTLYGFKGVGGVIVIKTKSGAKR